MSDTGESRPRPRVLFRFDTVERGIDIEEAAILADWLWKERNLAAGPLAERVETAMRTRDADPIVLEPNELSALRNVLCDAETSERTGLRVLRDTICGPALASD